LEWKRFAELKTLEYGVGDTGKGVKSKETERGQDLCREKEKKNVDGGGVVGPWGLDVVSDRGLEDLLGGAIWHQEK